MKLQQIYQSILVRFYKPSLLKQEKDASIKEKIEWVAAVIYEAPEFTRRAKIAANELGAGSIHLLEIELHGTFNPPEYLSEKFAGLGDWLAARQFAIFEILFHIGSLSLPLLRKVAFGKYDWTQGNAIEILCRLAAQNVEREKIIAELKQFIPNCDLNYEVLSYAIMPLISHAKFNESLQQVVRELMADETFKEVYIKYSAG